MKKSTKTLIGVGSAVALAGIATGYTINHNGNVETAKTNDTHAEKVAQAKTANKAESTNTTQAQKETKVASSETSKDNKTVKSADQTLPVTNQAAPTTSKVETQDTVKTVTKTNDNPPSATVSVQKKSNTVYTLHTATSLVDWMKGQDMDSSFANRLALANKYAIANYQGTASQNVQLLGILNGSVKVTQPTVKTTQSSTNTVKTTTPAVNETTNTNSSAPVEEKPVSTEPSQPTPPVGDNTNEQNVDEPTTTEPTQPQEPVQTPVAEEPPVVHEGVPDVPEDLTATKTTTETEPISYEIIRQNDATLEIGKQVVSQYGQNGVRTITYNETYVNGELTNREQVSSVVTQQPVNQIIKIGTKVPTPQVTASSILNDSGLFQKSANGNEFYWVDETGVQGIRVTLVNDQVKYIDWDSTPYVSRNVSEAELISILGESEGTAAYEDGQNVRSKIESMVQVAANAVYGSGTAQANTLYNQIINSGDHTFSF